MCEICSDVILLLETHDERLHVGDGMQLNKKEVTVVLTYISSWPQRQCMCCFKDFKNFERLNNVVQVVLNLAIRFMQTLTDDQEFQLIKEKQRLESEQMSGGEQQDKDDVEDTSEGNREKTKVSLDDENDEYEDFWSLADKHKLLQFVAKVFLMNFPPYVAYKHIVQSSLEDPDVPLYLLRNVCFFCDSNGIQAMNQCFEKATSQTLPFTVAHTLITIIANLRLWMNIATVMQYIIPLRTAVIRYMCKLSDKDLRMAGTRNMTDLMWAAVKEPLDTHFTYDKEGLDLAFKYFTCSTLTIRLAGIAQINSQINLYTESCNNETIAASDRMGNKLATWLIESEVIEHVFGPNLHVELIKQSQIILNFLAIEWRITNEHIDCIWAASQLKHCSKQVYDTLIPLIKNLKLHLVQHLLTLLSSLEPTAHTQSTLYLSSALIKCVWNTFSASHCPVSSIQHQPHMGLSRMETYTAITCEHEKMERAGLGNAAQHDISSSNSSQLSEGSTQGTTTKQEGQIQDGASCDKDRKAQFMNTGDIRHEDSEESNLSADSDISLPQHGLHRGSCSHVPQTSQPNRSRTRRKSLVTSRYSGSEVSDSDIEYSESSEEIVTEADTELESAEEELEPKIHPVAHQHLLHKCFHSRQCLHSTAHKGFREVATAEGEDSTEEEECEEVAGGEESEDSEFRDTDEEEELRQHVNLAHLKHEGWHTKDSEPDSSELDEELSEARLVQEVKLQYEAQQALKQQRAKQAQQAETGQLVEQASQLIFLQGGQHRFGPQRRQKARRGRPHQASAQPVMQEKMVEVGGSGDNMPSTSSDLTVPVHKLEEEEKQDDSHHPSLPHKQTHRQSDREDIEEMLSGKEGSCHSSQLSAKSDKNMADFEGEDVLSDEELAVINAHVNRNSHHMQHHLASMAPMFQTNMHSAGALQRRSPQKTSTRLSLDSYDFTLDDVCKPGITLLWDLVQDDKAHLLPDSLAMEAEKTLCTLVCFSTDCRIKMKFIEACIQNLSNNKSVAVSLRLLPKIFSSFQQYRSGIDTHSVTMWAEKELSMTKQFFNNLLHYTSDIKNRIKPSEGLYSHREEVQVRLMFLTCVFSSMGSPDSFRLRLDQVDTLWTCLATDLECSDECLSWFLNQAKSKDHHAMGLETFKHIFLVKMPSLSSELMSMIGLNLFQQLSHLTRMTNASFDKPLSEDQMCEMDQLWGVAVRALNTDVSMAAIHFLNSYYINYGNGSLGKEEEFVRRCMSSLMLALEQLEKHTDSNLLIIQRGLVLLKCHLEAFCKRYAFHLRNWQIDGKGILSHQMKIHDRQSTLIRVLLQPAGIAEKTTLELYTSTLVAELRAEITRWWEALQRQQQKRSSHCGSMFSPILGAMLGDGPIRMITLGQELTVDMDEKTLGDMQFKDMQLVLVSVGASRTPRKMDGTIPSSFLPPPDRVKLPMMLLLEEPYFEQLLTLMEELSNLPFSGHVLESRDKNSLQTKARVLSRKVWELLMLLPTNVSILEDFKSIVHSEVAVPGEKVKCVDWTHLLDPHRPHRLMYCLQIVEALTRRHKHRRRSFVHSGCGDSVLTSMDSEMSADGGESPEEIWSKQFIVKGGLEHIFHIFVSGSLQPKEGEFWNQWNQECLAYLLRLISQFAVDQSDVEACQDDVFESYENPKKKSRKQRSSSEKIVIPRLTQMILSMMNLEEVLSILMQILYDAAIPSEGSPLHTGSWGRAEVVHYSLSFLVSWAHSSDGVHASLCAAPSFPSWLKRIILEAPEPYVRREACMGLYRLCLGKASDNRTGYNFLLPVLASLLEFLPSALLIKPLRTDQIDLPKEKETYGAGCRDFFWLACRYVESVSKEDASPNALQLQERLVNMDDLSESLAEQISQRPYLESRHGYEEDDGLIGLINLCTATLKHEPALKTSPNGQRLLKEMFGSLFDLPSPCKRYLPRCNSQASRSATYDFLVEMVKGNVENFIILHDKMFRQHTKDSHSIYPWDYWPHEDGRSKCGYVGLTNLGATCYMATCMQHLYMIPNARQSVLQAQCEDPIKHEGTLVELQKMFAYLMESERKAYNPKSFCRVYTMDKQPLNTGEQKDMTEFFTDLISKLEEMSPELNKLVKNQFGGILTNNVVSLDCPHVSRTLEEFYTIRCQVTDMKNLYESLDEVTVKDMLEGDNMYTCSKCQKKVRAEKRACFKKLPKILCFNTMRYTFNMLTMMKEKVNTHFSFPLRLDMTQYMESHLMGPDKLRDDDDDEDNMSDQTDCENVEESYVYELIGVTVHTGTADGGHYYSFIRDRINRSQNGLDKWFLFNDVEVKSFDANQIASECFGGEMTSKTYDSVTDKFMDFSFEKTNSAYMLFYERMPAGGRENEVDDQIKPTQTFCFEMTEVLADWIWQDNMQFLQDKTIFEHTYFGFMWQVCGYLPTTLLKDDPQTTSLMAAQLSASFVLETLIHSKEKPTMLQWIELLTKQFNACPRACEWFLDYMTDNDWWIQQILIKCPNQMIRQMFQRLLIHVINQIRLAKVSQYLLPIIESEAEQMHIDVSELVSSSCLTRFIKKLLSILEDAVRPHSKHLAEYFSFLLEFSKMGDEECWFFIHVNAISTMISFYMGQKAHENYVEIMSDDDDEEEEVIAVTQDKYRPLSLEKMITLIAHLVEKSRGNDQQLHLSKKDYNNIVGKGFFFVFNQTRDNINVRQTCNLLFSLCRWNDSLAIAVVQMIFGAIKKLNAEQSQPFFKLLSMLVEFVGGPPGLPPFTQYILQRFWELTEYSGQQCLDWLSTQVTRNKLAHSWVLQQMDHWVETYLIAHGNIRVRNAAAYLLVSLVPSSHFRQAFRSARSMLSSHKELAMNLDSVNVLHKVYEQLLSLLPRARFYVDPQTHGTTKLMCYFALLTYCLVTQTEKLMFGEHFMELWQLFQPKLSEPQISMHHNKQALLLFWYQVCMDCPNNVQLMVTNAHVCKNIAFNYILADHDDQEVVMFNCCMLPAYYGLLRMCCQQSRSFTHQLAHHQNIQWAFKNISPYPAQYTAAVDELFKMMKLMCARYPDSTDEEIRAINNFRRNTMLLYLQNLDARSNWQTLVNALKILMDSTDDRLLVIYQQGLLMITEAFYTLHVMYHEATACHVTGDIVDLLCIVLSVLKVARHYVEKKGTSSADVKSSLLNWKERMNFVKRLLTLLNSYTPPDIRAVCIDVLKEMVMIFQSECLLTLVPLLTHAHNTFQDTNVPVAAGPYFPQRGQNPIMSNIRPPHPQFQMLLHSSQLEAARGIDDDYDRALSEYFTPYHALVDLLCRVAVNQKNLNRDIINLSAMVAFEGVPLHSPYFAKLWCEIYHSEQVDKEWLRILCSSNFFIDYVDAVLLDERLSMNNHIIYQFFCNYFSKVHTQVLSDQGRSLLDSLVASVTAEKSALENIESERELHTIAHRINGDLRAMMLIFSVQPPKQLSCLLMESLNFILGVCKSHQLQAELALSRQCHDTVEDHHDADTEKMHTDSESTPSKRRRVECGSNVEIGTGSDNVEITEDIIDRTMKIATGDDLVEKDKCVKDEQSAETDNSHGEISPLRGCENEDEQYQPTTASKPSASSSPSNSPSTNTRPSPREKPSWIDLVVRHIDSLFNLIRKK